MVPSLPGGVGEADGSGDTGGDASGVTPENILGDVVAETDAEGVGEGDAGVGGGVAGVGGGVAGVGGGVAGVGGGVTGVGGGVTVTTLPSSG